ncbi:MAG: glycoside hydrolase family 13 protein, partial [Clostridiales bacterium]|nr:glycoside hydrolase family 13 protein [Clostridiales bacterium]
MRIYHNSQNNDFRTPFGAVPIGTEVTVRIKAEGNVSDVHLRLWRNNEEIIIPMKKSGKFYIAKILADSPSLIWYFFIINTKDSTYYYGNNEEKLGGEGAVYESEPPSFQITVYKKKYRAPRWFQKSIVYQVFVDRFYNGIKNKAITAKRDDYLLHNSWNEPVSDNVNHNDFYGGNLLGIIEKLDYFKDLGVSVLYLNPIFEAYSNHKYDTGDYMKIDPMYGDEKTFKLLCKQAKKRNISIILDGVFNHTGEDSKYFNKYGHYNSVGAYQSVDSPHYNWYTFEEHPDRYQSWWNVPSLPQVNENCESYRDYIIDNDDSVVKHWLKAGARGWRLDVVDELPSSFVKSLRAAAKKTISDAVIIGEVWEDASNKVSYDEQREYFLGDELDGVLNYPFKNAINGFIIGEIDGKTLGRSINSIRENYPAESLYACMNLIGN